MEMSALYVLGVGTLFALAILAIDLRKQLRYHATMINLILESQTISKELLETGIVLPECGSEEPESLKPTVTDTGSDTVPRYSESISLWAKGPWVEGFSRMRDTTSKEK
jgi:hypothetical protein